MPRFCSNACRQKAYRARRPRVPELMRSQRRWVRADGKRPIQCDGVQASSTNPATWSTYEDVMRSTAGDGYGVMLGGGLGCYDFDHCIDAEGRVSERVRALLQRIRPESVVMVERSVSGRGLHVFVRARESRGFRRDGFEFYSRGRFIRVTGDCVRLGVLVAP